MKSRQEIESLFRAHCAAERELAEKHLAMCESPLDRVVIKSLYLSRKACAQAIGEAYIEVVNEDTEAS